MRSTALARRTAMAGCWLVIAFCTACAAGSDVRPELRPDTHWASASAGPDRLAAIAARLDLALADVCDCRGQPVAGRAALELCGYPIKIETREELQASTNGRRIRITTGMLRFFAHEDELAFVLAHELSHILLGHAGAFNGLSPRTVEAEADRLGIQIVSKADFDTAIAAEFPERLARSYPGTNSRSGAYGSPTERRTMISAALREETGQQGSAGLPGACDS